MAQEHTCAGDPDGPGPAALFATVAAIPPRESRVLSLLPRVRRRHPQAADRAGTVSFYPSASGSARAAPKAGLPPYLTALLLHRRQRGALMRSGLSTVANLLLMGILIDSICQWLILGTSYAGAALVVGPVLIVAPYAVSRALTNR